MNLDQHSRLAVGDLLPHGRGSVSTRNRAVAILSRAREQAGFGRWMTK
jgi:hypothetical protein